MFKRVLIVSPQFPPINAPDMQRVRMSLPYYGHFGWQPVVICVDEKYVNGFKDSLLLESIPAEVEVHKVRAFKEGLTRLVGLGSLSMRSYYYFKKKGDELLKRQKFDLVFFSTTQFHVCALGPYWKRKFGVPFIVDMQDPWRNDFYLTQPKSLQPPKFRFAHLINKILERRTMPFADAIISVSSAYIDTLRDRYIALSEKPAVLIPFGASAYDFDLVRERKVETNIFSSEPGIIRVVYIGAVTDFFLPIIKAFFVALERAIARKELYRFYFIGTNYSTGGVKKKIEDIASEAGLGGQVFEIPQRIPYFEAIAAMQQADILFIPGSVDAEYNASKVYNNILARKPLFAIFNQNSVVNKVIRDANAGVVVDITGTETEPELIEKIIKHIPEFEAIHNKKVNLNMEVVEAFSAKARTKEQVVVFEQVINH